jgi:hypothetical protein
MHDEDTEPSSFGLIAAACGTLLIFCFMTWSMFADSKTAGCVTKAQFAARDDIQVHDVRWTASAGCEYFASIITPGLTKADRRKAATNKADALWMPEARVMRDRGAR